MRNQMSEFLISSSLLSANFAKLGQEAKDVLKAGADLIHLDIMDNHYVPNLTFGPLVCEALRNDGIECPIDVHLMTKPVDKLIIEFAAAGASMITFHPEGSDHVDRSIELIHKHHCKAGLAINPATSLNCLEWVLAKLDIVLIMSVNPGFGGQSFLQSSIQKINIVKEMINSQRKEIILAVDGGINSDNISSVARAGANMFVIGSAIFKQPNYNEVIRLIRNNLAQVVDEQT